MTSTGGEITVVNLVGEQCTVLGKMNNTTCSITNIFQFSLSKFLRSAGMLKQESPHLGTDITPGLPTEERGEDLNLVGVTRHLPLQQHVDAGRDGQETVCY